VRRRRCGTKVEDIARDFGQWRYDRRSAAGDGLARHSEHNATGLVDLHRESEAAALTKRADDMAQRLSQQR